MTPEDEIALRAKLRPMIARINALALTETDFDTVATLLDKDQKKAILTAALNNDTNLLTIVQGMIAQAELVKADVIIDKIIQKDKIDLTYLLRIL
jgi:hypothetical protein